MMRQPLQHILLLQVGAVILAATGVACAPTSAKVAAPTQNQETPSLDASPEELVETIRTASRQSAEVSKLLKSGLNRSLRLDELKRRIDTGVQAADQLIRHPESSDAQIQRARLAKLELLYRGARQDLEAFQPPLNALVDQLLAENPRSEAAAVGSAIRIELACFSRASPKEDVLPSLVEHARAHPDSDTGIELFRQYARKLESAGDPSGAATVYRTAVQLYGGREQVEPLRRRLAAIQQAEQASARRKAAERAKILSIQRRLGNRPNGYFLIYAKENKPPRNGVVLYSFKYEVLEGLSGATNFALSLRENWSWELIRCFPYTPSGREQANQLAEELTKKRTFIKY